MKNKRGFTIIELGVVIVLIGLMAILLSPFVKVVRQKAHKIRCINNLRKISLAIREYALENDEKLPEDIALIYTEGYITKESVFDCPFSSHEGSAKEPDYVYVNNFDFKSSGNPAIVYDKQNNHKDGTVYVLYLNGEIVSRYR